MIKIEQEHVTGRICKIRML